MLLSRLLLLLFLLVCGIEVQSFVLLQNPTFHSLASTVPGSFENPDFDQDDKLLERSSNVGRRVHYGQILNHGSTDVPDPDDIPINFVFHNFLNTAFENAAKHGVIDALRLANAALSATDELTSSYYRYFQMNDLETVKKVYESIITESIFAPCAGSHIINIWFDDSIAGFDGCAEGFAAYHITPGPGVTGLNIILCPQLFKLHPQPLDGIPRDNILGFTSEAMETVGLTILHEMTHLAVIVGGLIISDTYIQSQLDVTRSNPTGYVKAYGAYLSMMANRNEEAGSQNADNYAFFAAESYFMQEYGIAGFKDPPPSGLTSFHPARAVKTSMEQPKVGLVGFVARKLPIPVFETSVLREALQERDTIFRLPGPGQPQNWMFVNFPPGSPHILDAIVTGLFDAWRLADAALEGLRGEPTISYRRYFQPDDMCDVEDIFYAVLREAAIPSSGVAHNQRTWKIYYDDKGLPNPQCYKEEDYAYFIETPNYGMPTIVVCPAQFAHYPRVLDQIPCSQVGLYASEAAMDNIGATLLHKMLHDYGMTGDAAGIFASDVEFRVNFQNADGSSTRKIVKGYGPYWSRYVNNAQHAGTSNVDSYVWFALETFFSQKCGIEFQDPAVVPADGVLHPARSITGHQSSHILDGEILQAGRRLVRRRDITPPDGVGLFHVPFFPNNTRPADFPVVDLTKPEILLFRKVALMRVIDAFNLAEVAVQASNSDPLTRSFTRYFQSDQLCIVRNLFPAIMQVSGTVLGTSPGVNRAYTSCNNNWFLTEPQCTTTPWSACSNASNSDFADSTCFVCRLWIMQQTCRLDKNSFDKLRATPYLSVLLIPVESVPAHDTTDNHMLLFDVANTKPDDMPYDKRDVRSHGMPEPSKAYRIPPPHIANKRHHDGIHDTDVYAYAAFEVFLANECGLGLNGLVNASAGDKLISPVTGGSQKSMLGRRIDRAGQNMTKRAYPTSDGNMSWDSWFRDNIFWADFPLIMDTQMGLTNVRKLVSAASIAPQDESIDTSFTRYIRADNVCKVTEMYKSTAALSGIIPPTTLLLSRKYTSYYSDGSFPFKICCSMVGNQAFLIFPTDQNSNPQIAA